MHNQVGSKSPPKCFYLTSKLFHKNCSSFTPVAKQLREPTLFWMKLKGRFLFLSITDENGQLSWFFFITYNKMKKYISHFRNSSSIQ